MIQAGEPCPLPDLPALAEAAAALRDTGHWGMVLDDRWRLAYMTDELRLSFGAHLGLVPIALGEHFFGTRSMEVAREWPFGPNTGELVRLMVRDFGGWLLADTPGGREAVRAAVDPSLADLVDDLEPGDTAAAAGTAGATALWGTRQDIPMLAFRIREAGGGLAGNAFITKPAAGMAAIATLVSMADLRHLERAKRVVRASRRPAALLFADLEGSSRLSRRLSTAGYFALGRRLVRAADQCVIDAGGLVGRHVGDGVVAFFLAEVAGSESAAARECVTAARALRAALAGVAERSGLDPGDVVLRFGLHWGATPYVGAVTTGGRSEVTALGDEVNEAARIEACATGGRTLASKALVERLDPADASALDIDLGRLTYTMLADLPEATEKARRDAPAIAVCEL
ncbi:MAG: adenylate/guanylate cyclase domain-containing protein [Solirubrobacteraceae bacterium]